MIQRNSNNKGNCKICVSPYLSDISKLIDNGTPPTSIPAMFGNVFDQSTLYRHLRNCLTTNQFYFLEKQKIKVLADVERRMQPVIAIAQEALDASREALLVDGQINFQPRDWEIKVVYEHPFLKDSNDKPLVLTDTLDNVINLLRDNGIKVKRSILKQEDMRKTLRESIASIESLFDKMIKLFGQRDVSNLQHQQYDRIRQYLENIAIQEKTNYITELKEFLTLYKDSLRPDIKDILLTEVKTITGGGMPTKRDSLFEGLDTHDSQDKTPPFVTEIKVKKNTDE